MRALDAASCFFTREVVNPFVTSTMTTAFSVLAVSVANKYSNWMRATFSMDVMVSVAVEESARATVPVAVVVSSYTT